MEVVRRNERGQQEEEDEVEEVMLPPLQGRRQSTIHPHRAEEAAEDVQEFLKDRHIHLAPEEEAEEKTDAESNYGFPGMQLASVKLSISDVNNENEELDFAVKSNGKQELNTLKTNGDQELGFTGETNGDQELDDTINTNGDLQFDASYKSYGDQESNTGTFWDPQIPNFHPYGNAIFENEEIIQIKNVGQEYSVGKGSVQKFKDVDVVTVLQKQETHDLFCPNCNSCITKRVILRKRKRMFQDIQQQVKGDKFENLTASEINTIPEDSTIPVADSNAGNGEPEVFRCLSCLSLFTPKGRGFKLFGIFGGRSGGENMTPEETPVKLNQSPHLPSEEDVIITVEAGPSTEVVTQTVDENLVEVNEVQQWDILKSIVYGGQVESITSLGVVLSAAGADTSTVNVLALGLANLIGGLFIIGHNLRDLKKEQSYQPSTENDEQVDRYTETLGRRENFIRHAVVAMLAFLIFGLLPPIIYGFTFRASDDRDYKCIAVLAASLFCIALLALGKAHTKSPPKSYFKTVVYFVSIAIVASGASFIVGSLIKKLLDKLGWFETSTSSTIYMPFAEATHSGSWSSF